MREQIEKRLEILKAQRGQLAQSIAQNRQHHAQLEANLLQHDGAIAELSALINPPKGVGVVSNMPQAEGEQKAAAPSVR